jgi:hypothetical protein
MEGIMNKAKNNIIKKLDMISDDITNEYEIVERLHLLSRLEHSKERCKSEGTCSDEEMLLHLEMSQHYFTNL